jgi:hypothetical protein
MPVTSRTPAHSAGRGRFARTAASTRPRPYARVRPRRQPQKTGMAKVLGRLPAPAAGSRKGKAGGFAALAAAAAGLAFRNRDKLGGLMSRKRSDDPGATPRSESATTPPA